MDMKVNFSSYNFTFKSKPIPKMPPEGIEMGIDGYEEGNAWRRAVMGDYHELDEYSKYYEPPKSEEEMNRMLKSWGLEVDKYTEEIKVPRGIRAARIDNNCLLGMIPNKDADFKTLKNAGITTIINTSPSLGSGLQKICRKFGLNYMYFGFNEALIQENDGIFNDVAFESEKDIMLYLETEYGPSNYDKKSIMQEYETYSREFIDSLIKAVNAMQQGYCFIGCIFGVEVSSVARRVIDFFNPKADYHIDNYDAYEQTSLNNLYKKLTHEDKKLMGWTKEFESQFLKRFAHI